MLNAQDQTQPGRYGGMQHRKKQRKDDFHGSHNRELRRKDSEKAAEKAEVPAAPAKRTLTLEEVRAVLADKSRAGHTAEIRELLKKYGASKLSLVDPKHYESLLREAEVL